jgi:hypothetical protein
MIGWLCPRCGASNSPHTPQCITCTPAASRAAPAKPAGDCGCKKAQGANPGPHDHVREQHAHLVQQAAAAAGHVWVNPPRADTGD